MIIGVCVILIIAFVTAMAFVARRYRDDEECETGFLSSLFIMTLFAIAGFFLLVFVFDVLSHDIR